MRIRIIHWGKKGNGESYVVSVKEVKVTPRKDGQLSRGASLVLMESIEELLNEQSMEIVQVKE